MGDRAVEIDQVLHSVRYWSMFITDAGAVYAQDDHSVRFTDGGSPRKIASQACAISTADYQSLGLVTGNAGHWSRGSTARPPRVVTWSSTTPAPAARWPATGSRRATRTHAPRTLPSPGLACLPDVLVGQHVYFGRFDDEMLVEHQRPQSATPGVRFLTQSSRQGGRPRDVLPAAAAAHRASPTLRRSRLAHFRRRALNTGRDGPAFCGVRPCT